MKMGFINKDETVTKQPIVEETFTNAICYGQTGSGKTTGFMLPNIENRIKLNHGLLIYDFKGNIHEQVKYLASKYNKLESVYEIGKPWTNNIDILDYATTKSLQNMFNSLAENHENDYWSNSAYSLFDNIYFLLKNLKLVSLVASDIHNDIAKFENNLFSTKYYPTIKNIAYITKSAKSLKKFFREIKKVIIFFNLLYKETIIKQYYSKENEQLISKFIKILNDASLRFDSLEEYHNININDNDSSNSGNNGVLQVLNNTIRSVSNKECFSKNEFDIVKNLLDGKIVIIDVSGFNNQMLNFLNLSIYNRLIRQTSIKAVKSPITIFVDEAQKVIDNKSIPDTDICRENNFEFIIATQDKLLLEKQLGTQYTEILLRNMTSQYSFKTTTSLQDTAVDTKVINKFEYINILENKKFVANPIFIDDNKLFDVEYRYQKSINAFSYANVDTKKRYILKYLPEIYEEYKALIYFKTTKEIKIVDAFFDTSELDKLIDEFNIENQKNKSEKIDLSRMENMLLKLA